MRALVFSLSCLGCTPDVDPPWLIERPTELALSVTVTQQGPYGLEHLPDDAPRLFQEALPLDTVQLEPFVADRGGPIALEDLSALWVACPAIECLEAIADADRLPSCATGFDLATSCSLGPGPRLQFTLPDFPPDLHELSLFALALAPSVAFVASRVGEPGADVCAQRLRAREPLGECVMMLRDVELGALQDLVDAAETAGIAVDIGEGTDELLAVPRNRAPRVETFSVSGSSRQADGEVVAGTSVLVADGDEIEIAYLPGPEDLEMFEIMIDAETTLTFEETHSGQWWLDRSAVAFTSADLRARWTVSGDPGTAYAYFVLRDGRGSEAWGWLAFEVQD